jgi:ATP-binding cassette subfamily C protein
MGKALKIFFRTEGANPWVVVVCLFIAGLFEGLSVASLLPMLSIAQGDGAAGGGGKFGKLAGHMLDGVSFDSAISILLGVVLAGIALKSVLTYLAMRYVGYAVAEVSTIMRMRIIR